MLPTIRHFLSLIRFSHTVFALPFALFAAVMAWHLPVTVGERVASTAVGEFPDFGGGLDVPFQQRAPIRWQELVGILLCMVTARSFAMATNRLADRRLDAENPRTAGRHLPAGILTVPQVTIFVVLCAAGFIASTLLFLPNRLPLLCSVPVLLFLAGYSFTKRFTSLAHFWLGTALALSPLAAWIAIRGEQVLNHPADALPAIVLGLAVLSWVAGFDIIYACQDYDSDLRAGLHSVPVKLGIRRSLQVAALCHFATVVLLACLPLVYPALGWPYWAGIVAIAALLVYEHALVRPNDLSRINAAFFNVNAIISIGLLVVGSLDLWLRGR